MEKQLGVRFPEELLKKLEELAKQEQRSLSQVVRMAVEAYVEPKGHAL